MPLLRGIDISIVTQPGTKKLPEFPHPGPSSSTCCAPPYSPPVLGELGTDIPLVESDDPYVSVYIPSSPGSQFGIHYSADEITDSPCYLYFKLLLNGRNIANWGTNLATQSSGSVTRALFGPDDRWHYKENGVVHKREGIEARCFYFLPASSSISVADDGGLVEVQVFRSKGRKRRAPVLGQHREQKSYGIASPSGGLLESPEDAYYYDWVLIDPKQYPFVSFRFHYRSWENLRQLNLIPELGEFVKSGVDGSPGKPHGSSSDMTVRPQTHNPIHPIADFGVLRKGEEESLVQTLLGLLEVSTREGQSSCVPEVPRSSPLRRPLPEIPQKKTAVTKFPWLRANSAIPPRLPYIEEEPAEGDETGSVVSLREPVSIR